MKSLQPDFKPVYILGAGASVMLGAPVLSDFLTRARGLIYSPQFPNLITEALRDKLRAAFQNAFHYHGYLAETKQYLGIDLGNLETLFSIVDMDIQTSKITSNEMTDGAPIAFNKGTLREDFYSVIVSTLKAFTNYKD